MGQAMSHSSYYGGRSRMQYRPGGLLNNDDYNSLMELSIEEMDERLAALKKRFAELEEEAKCNPPTDLLPPC